MKVITTPDIYVAILTKHAGSCVINIVDAVSIEELFFKYIHINP